MKNKIVVKCSLILVVFVLVFLFTGCKSDSESRDYSDMYLVVYDGNGGYLGSKTHTTRKLRVSPNSKIPKYTSDYTPDQYIVSSLGKAIRDGYSLKGWYLEENATYQEDENGNYIHLSLEENNGIYKPNDEGEYVLTYVLNSQGKYIFIYFEEAPAGVDQDELEYIYYQGDEGYGYYIYDPDNAEHASVYEQSGSFNYNTASKYGNIYYNYYDLTDEEKEFFSEASRFNAEFRSYTKEDEGLQRYSFESGYAEIDSIMELADNGEYVLIDDDYVLYDANNPNHQGLDRYSIKENYVFTRTATITSPSQLKRYEATFIYWDFEKDRVTKDIILKAHWVKKKTVIFREMTGQETKITTKMNENNSGEVDLVPGEPIGKFNRVPQYTGYTFVGWSKSETEYIPWDFEKDVFPLDSDNLILYAYMIEGTYERITTASELAKVANNPAGNYILCNDIDLDGAIYINKSPLGFTLSKKPDVQPTVFTGKFISFGYKISNFTLKVENSSKLIEDKTAVVSGLFPYVQNATIEGIRVEDVTVQIETVAPRANVIFDLGSGGLVGTALEGNTLIKDCYVDVTFVATSADQLDCDVYVGDVVVRGKEFVTVENTTSDIDYSAIMNITTGELITELN